ncbi:MAG: hypothetical protein PHX62_06705 [Bacilli bacterium]|nr:hypothetical protein [Bacilli bacterium]
MKKLKLVESLLALLCAILLLATTVFAWISLSPKAEIQEFVVTAGDYDVEVSFSINKNGGDYYLMTTKTQIENFFQDAVPNDNFGFRLSVKNISDFEISADIVLANVLSSNVETGYNILDVFFIVDGVIMVNEDEEELTPNSLLPVTLYGQNLELYRLSNLLDDNNNILLLDDLAFTFEETIVIEFNLKYDHTTSQFSYQEGVLNIDSIFVRFN